MRILRRSTLLILFLSLWTAGGAWIPVMAAGKPVVKPGHGIGYKQAFLALQSGQCGPAENLVTRGSDPTLNLVLRGLLMAQPGNSYSFDELAGFVSDHPDWPGLNGILMIAEQKIPSSATPEQIVNWFTAYPPLTLVGFYRYIDALDVLGQWQKARDFIRDRWINRDFQNGEMTAFQSRFGHLLTQQDHRSRLNRLLWDNNVAAARAMYPYVDASTKALAEARIALANQKEDAEFLIGKVPKVLQDDPGLMYERLRWLRKNNLDENAIDILKNTTGYLERPEKWWAERHIIIRRLMEKGDFRLAYKLASNHGLQQGQDYLQAEFLAGWLALRFLKRADIAHDHFKALLEAASTPISRARGAYWLGQTLETLGDKEMAMQAYETAAALNTTFYGQLAITRLYTNPMIRSDPESPIPSSVRAQFSARPAVKAVSKLYHIGEKDLARKFFKALTDYASQRFEFVLLMELAYELQRPDWAISAAKAAAQKNMLIGAGSFPVLSMRIPEPPDLALTHALIKQESMFNASANSPAGARGLMQIMPSTAKDICRKTNITYRESKLLDPDYNVRLGTAFTQEQLDKFDGSYVLALAGYNAGPARVREWIDKFGDPRSPNVDPVDWIEMMPIYETRNYVQRVIENLQFYRARLNGGKARLQILEDLKR